MIFIQGMPIQAEVWEVVQDIKNEVDQAGIDLLKHIKQSGENIMVTCPVHKGGTESRPSCGISTHEVQRGNDRIPVGTVNCFTCGYVASLPEFISTVFGYNDRGKFGFKWLSRRYSYVEVEHRKPVKFDFGKKETKKDIEFVPEEVLDKYRFTHPYMYQRGLEDEFIDYFDVGFDEEAGSITFPVNNIDGRCMFIQRRSVFGKRFENDTDASKATLYAIDKLYQRLDWVKEKGYVAIAESPIDIITLWQWGEPALGTLQALPSKEQITLLNDLPVDMLIAAGDNDKAGQVGATRLRDKTSKLIKRLIFPKGVKDINEMRKEEYFSAPKTVAFKSVRNF